MHSKLALVGVTLLASLIPTTFADDVGKANIQNNCDATVYVWSIAHSADEKMHEIQPGKSYSESYRLSKNGGGVSLKMSLTQDQSEVSQFEYTLNEEKDEPKVFYDLSNIDGYPFKDGGITITPTDDTCEKVKCASGVAKCTGAYNQPYDDHATHGCHASADLNMVLCADQPEAKKKAKKGKQQNRVCHPHARNCYPAPNA
jgi:hypothetical protein